MLMGLFFIFISGRRALQLTTLFSFILVFIISLITKKKINYSLYFYVGLIAFISLILIQNLLGINNIFEVLIKTILTAFATNDPNNPSGGVRMQQSLNLINRGLKSPIWGYGLNSYMVDNIRSGVTKWSYEMVYFAFFFQTGIIGISVFCFLVANTCIRLLKNIRCLNDNARANNYFAILVAFLCFIIAGSSNPFVRYLPIWIFVLT
jgi:hypothetical protein